MNSAYLWLFLALTTTLEVASSSTGTGPLFLTPLIDAENYTQAKNESKVDLLKTYDINASAYSGYISVNNRSNHMFFLFVEAENNSEEAPLLLWTQGGPGLSALFGLLLQNGPLAFDIEKNLSKRELTIQKHANVIYLDAPVGAGFSFTKGNTTYSRSLEHITADIVEFLQQFVKLFKEYQGRGFYAAGDSYAARYSVALADYMLRCPGQVNLTFQGIIGGVGFLAPIMQLADSSDFLYQASMLDMKGYTLFKRRFETIRNITLQGNYSLALYLLEQTIFAYEHKKTLYQNLTLYNSYSSPLYTEMPPSMLYCFAFVNSSFFKQAIHAGEDTSLQYNNPYLLGSLAADYLVDITNRNQYVLNTTRVLFYTGQLDVLFPSANLLSYFEKLDWSKAGEYRNASRLSWKPYGDNITMAGYTKSAGNFTSAVVIGMGHYAGFDKPVETYYLMKEFFEQKISFSRQ